MSAAAVTTEQPRVAQPFVKWAGGKRSSLPELSRFVPPEFGVYYEPFVGGAAMYYHLHAQGRIRQGAAWLGDANEWLMRTYVAVRDEHDVLVKHLRMHAKMHAEDPEGYYYKIRAAGFERSTVGAARFIYLNRTCFNGLYRVNFKTGAFNVPVGRYKNPTICDEANLMACVGALRGVHLMARGEDFEKTVSTAQPGSLVYFDPPYPPKGGYADFTEYTPGGFKEEDHKRLAACARHLKRHGVHVIVSNADLPMVRELYHDFNIHRIEVRRNINSRADRRGAVGELIIT